MERLISLFREPDYDSWSPSQAQPPPQEAHAEPLYFEQLLEYLRKRKDGEDVDDVDFIAFAEDERDEADTLIGCCAERSRASGTVPSRSAAARGNWSSSPIGRGPRLRSGVLQVRILPGPLEAVASGLWLVIRKMTGH